MNGQMALEPGLGYLSWSRLSKYNNCGEQYRLTYVQGVPSEPSGAAIAGRAMHDAIRDAEASESWADPEDMFTMQFAFNEYFTQYIDEAGGPDACRWGGTKDKVTGKGNEDYNWWIRYAGPLFCTRYGSVRLDDEEKGCRLVDAEFEVGVTVEGRHVVGYIDSLMVNADGEAVVRDWKTGRQVDPYQLGVYSWMLEHSERNITADIGHIGYLRGNDLSKQLKIYDIRAWRELVPRMLADLVKGVETDLFPLRPSPFCVACGVRAHCDYGRTLDG